MAYSDNEFKNLSWMDKMRYITQDTDRLASEKQRAQDVFNTTGSAEAKNYLGQLNALGSGVNPENVISGNYDVSKYEWRPTDDAKYGTGVRTTLNRYGIGSEAIGWTDDGKGLGTVTLGGKSAITPDRVINGVSYVDDAGKVLNAAIDYYKGKGQNIVKLSDYTSNSSLPFEVNYNSANGLVSVGGQTVKPVFTDGGYAYIDAAQMDKAIEAAKNQSGYRSGSEILDKYSQKYEPYYEKLLDAMVNRKAYSYDPESDPVYQSYREQYNREGDRAMRDAMGAASGMTGGYTNSAAAAAGAQQRQYWQDKLMDRIPELEANAYNRYLGEYDLNQNALSAVMGIDNNRFNREYDVSRDLRSDIAENNAQNRQRYLDEYEKMIDERNFNYQKEQSAAANEQWEKQFGENKRQFDLEHELAKEEHDMSMKASNLNYEQALAQQMILAGQTAGYYSPEQNATLAKIWGYPIGTTFDPFGQESNTALRQYQLNQMYGGGGTSSKSSSGSSGKSSKSSGGFISAQKQKENDEKVWQALNDLKTEKGYVSIYDIPSDDTVYTIIRTVDDDSERDRIITNYNISDADVAAAYYTYVSKPDMTEISDYNNMDTRAKTVALNRVRADINPAFTPAGVSRNAWMDLVNKK